MIDSPPAKRRRTSPLKSPTKSPSKSSAMPVLSTRSRSPPKSPTKSSTKPTPKSPTKASAKSPTKSPTKLNLRTKSLPFPLPTSPRTHLSRASHAQGKALDQDQEDEAEDYDQEEQFNKLASASDRYILHSSIPAKTSSNLFSDLIDEPITFKAWSEFDLKASSIIAKSQSQTQSDQNQDPKSSNLNFKQWTNELDAGFSVLIYGLGSKAHILKEYAQYLATNHDHRKEGKTQILYMDPLEMDLSAVVTWKDLSALVSPSNVQTILLIPALERFLRSPKAVSFLASVPDIRLLGSMTHVNSGLVFAGLLKSRKFVHHRHSSVSDSSGPIYIPYPLLSLDQTLPELLHSSISDIIPHMASVDASKQVVSPVLSAGYVYRSVTRRARELFDLVVEMVLERGGEEAEGEDGDGELNAGGDAKYPRISLKLLQERAIEALVALSKEHTVALMAEFVDHGLIKFGKKEGKEDGKEKGILERGRGRGKDSSDDEEDKEEEEGPNTPGDGTHIWVTLDTNQLEQFIIDKETVD